MKGFLAGVVTGAVVSGVGFLAAERFLPPVELQARAPEAGEVAVPAGSEFNAERPDAPPILPGTDPTPDAGLAPAVIAPAPDSDALPDTTPLDEPVPVALDGAGLTAPEDSPPPIVVAGSGSEIPAQPSVSQPAAPQVDVAAAPVQPADTPVTGAAPVSPGQPESETEPVVEPSDVAALPQVTQAPATPAEPSADAGPSPEAAASAEAPQTGAAPETPAGPAPDADAPAGPAEIAALPQTGAAPETPAGPGTGADAPPIAVPEAPSGLRLPVPEIEDMAPGVTTDRLPRIGAEEPVEEASPSEPALTRFAVPYEAPEDSPMMALVLIDVGDVRPSAEVLAELPLPLAVALDPTLPDAAALMRSYREAGLEIAILTPLPKGAAPADVEVAFAGFLRALPEAVAVMDIPEGLLQESRPRAVQVIEILAETGHGLVTYERGLNPALQIAPQKNVAAAAVFRSIDPGNHDVVVMKRFLDQAAFRAGQEGRVILTAEARPETLTALAEWSLGTRAATVAFAPLSVVLSH